MSHLPFLQPKKRNNQELSLKLSVLAKHSWDTHVGWEALTAVKPSTDVVPSQERKTRLLHHKKLPEKPAQLDTHTYTQAHTYFPTLLKQNPHRRATHKDQRTVNAKP